MNPVENVWVLVKLGLPEQDVLPANQMDLFYILSKILNELTDEYLRNLVAPMPNSAEMVRKSRGRSIKY